ncbi:MAG: trans-aconitate 2-methyltransferase [Candidatus Nanosalina sp.]
MEIDPVLDSAVERIEKGESQDLSIYGDLAPVYHFLYGNEYDYEGQADLVEDAAPDHVERICDGGCGSGGLTDILAERYPEAEVLGVDLNSEMLEVARDVTENLQNMDFRSADLLEVEGEFDIYTIFGTTSHFPPEELQELFNRIHENLIENGVLVFDYKSPESKKHEDGHLSEWSRESENYVIESPAVTIYQDGQPHYVFSFNFREKETGEDHYTGQIMQIDLYTPEDLAEMLEEAGFSEIEVEEEVLDQSGVVKAWK